jgi:L-asparagine transporter-like permease
VKVSAIVVFIILGSWMLYAAPDSTPIGFKNYQDFLPHGWGGTWIAVIVAIFSYLGIETVAVAAGEASDPQRAVTTAFRSTILRLVLFYLLTIGLMLAIVPWSKAGSGTSPFVMTMEALHIPGAAGIMNFVILVAALSSMNSQLYTATRTMFSLGRAGQAPARFGVLNARGVPTAALAISCFGIALAMATSILMPEGGFVMMMAVSMFGALFTWMMIFVTHFFFRRQWAASGAAPLPFRMRGYPWLTILGALLMLAVLVTTAFTNEFSLTLLTGVPFLAALGLMYFVRFRR